MEYKCHIYNIPGVPNMRDIGGYRAKDGRMVAMGRFIRSTALAKIDEAAEAQLMDIGIDCVIDLRSTYERTQAPDKIEAHDHIFFAHVPMLDYIQSNINETDLSIFPESMPQMYCDVLDNAPAAFFRVFELFADPRFSCCLYHCTAGKDRTGVTTMLLLGLAGVPDDVIIEDYSYTETLLPRTVMGLRADLPGYLFESNPQTMRDTISHLRGRYGSAAGYLGHIGIDELKQRVILEKLFGE